MEPRWAGQLLFTQMKHKLELMRKHGLSRNQNSIFHLWDVQPWAHSLKDPLNVPAKCAERAQGWAGEVSGPGELTQGSWQPLCRMEGTETRQSLVLASSWTVES